MKANVLRELYDDFKPVPVPADGTFARADVEVFGINHFRPSYVAMLFFNDPDLTIKTATVDRPSYAGSFAIFGHRRCVGDEGHCEVHTDTRRFDVRPSHPLTRAFKRVTVTDPLRACLADGPRIKITMAVTSVVDGPVDWDGPLLDIAGLQIATFD